jgi:hypothetical protein
MAKGRDTLLDAAETVRPYVERAMRDERLREEVLRALATAREVYGDLVSDKDRPLVVASRVATDDEVRDKLRDAIDDLRSANERLQGRRERSSRASVLLVLGIAIGILYNPITGAETRRFIRDLVTGGSDDVSSPGSTNGGLSMD